MYGLLVEVRPICSEVLEQLNTAVPFMWGLKFMLPATGIVAFKQRCVGIAARGVPDTALLGFAVC
ncbi:hypothetical protein D3C81_2245630 [compost metagenome]